MKKKLLFIISIVCMIALSLCLIACDSSSGNGGDGGDGGDGGGSAYKIYFDANGGEFDSDPYVMTGTDGRVNADDFPEEPTRGGVITLSTGGTRLKSAVI